MPLYDCQCRACGRIFEVLTFGEALEPCPACSSQEVVKLAVGRIAPQGKSAALVRSARAQAAREGHFSHYGAAERPRK